MLMFSHVTLWKLNARYQRVLTQTNFCLRMTKVEKQFGTLAWSSLALRWSREVLTPNRWVHWPLLVTGCYCKGQADWFLRREFYCSFFSLLTSKTFRSRMFWRTLTGNTFFYLRQAPVGAVCFLSKYSNVALTVYDWRLHLCMNHEFKEPRLVSR